MSGPGLIGLVSERRTGFPEADIALQTFSTIEAQGAVHTVNRKAANPCKACEKLRYSLAPTQ
jgi:hypothetical protein